MSTDYQTCWIWIVILTGYFQADQKWNYSAAAMRMTFDFELVTLDVYQ